MINIICKQYPPILRPVNKMSGNLEIKMQNDNLTYLIRFTGGESERLKGNVVANPKTRYH